MVARFIKPAISLLLLFGLITLAITTYKTWSLITRSMPVREDAIVIEVKPGSTANMLVETLFQKKLVDSRTLLLNFIKFEGLTHRLKSGIYQVIPGESVSDLIHRIVDGDVLTLTFQITEGMTVKQIGDNLKNAPWIQYHASDWSAIARDHVSAEGLLLADTYQYVAGSQAVDLLHTAHKKLNAYLESSWQTRSPDLPWKTYYDMLIAASILEKETAIPGERKLIAGVIVNRMTQHMPLQMDPTVIYAMGIRYTGKLTHDDLGFDSPYNTYRYRGLPPTPIAMVGREAIDAAAQPQRSDYLYFVAKGDGSHEFSKTYVDQRKAIFRYMNKGSQ